MQEKLAIYHNANGTNHEDQDRMIFGNFEDDLESGQNVELDASQFDADNFIIEDEETDFDRQPLVAESDPKREPFKVSQLNVEDFALGDDIDDYGGKIINSTSNRNY